MTALVSRSPVKIVPFQQPSRRQASAPLEHLVPFNVEAEEAVLGSLLLDAQAIHDVADVLTPAQFYRETNAWVFQAALSLLERGDAIDILTVRDELERAGRLEDVGGASFLTSLLNQVPTSVHIRHYARIVERDAVRRRLISAASDIATLAYQEDGDLDEQLVEAQRVLLQATDRRGKRPVLTASEALMSREQFMSDQKNQGLNTGLRDVDNLLGGLRSGKLYVLAGRPGMGKSTVVFNLAGRVAVQGKRAYIASLEMSHEDVMSVLISARTGLPVDRVSRGWLTQDEIVQEQRMSAQIAQWPLLVDDDRSVTITEMQARIQRAHAQAPLSLVVIDYLQLLCRSVANRVAEIGEIARSAREIALDIGAPVILLSQLSRDVEKRHVQRPTLADLYESGYIEAHADVVLLLYRDDYYNKDTLKPNVLELIAAKQRGGRTGTIELMYDFKCARIENKP